MTLRVYVDYNTMAADSDERVFINTRVYPELLKYLRSGLPLILYDDESLEVDAVAEFDEEMQRWYGVPDESTHRDLPPLSDKS